MTVRRLFFGGPEDPPEGRLEENGGGGQPNLIREMFTFFPAPDVPVSTILYYETKGFDPLSQAYRYRCDRVEVDRLAESWVKVHG